MKKVLIAGLVTVCVMMTGMTVSAAERVIPRCTRAHGACHRQLDALWQGDCVRHDCAYVDADGNGLCDNCSWLEGRHHCLDENGYCLNGSCNYDNCGYAHGTGYCRGYCNSLTVDGGAASVGASSQEALSLGGTDAGGSSTDQAAMPQGNQAAQGSADAASGNGGAANGAYGSGNGAGNGSGSGYNDGYGYWGYGHHGSGHHGGGHHGCR